MFSRDDILFNQEMAKKEPVLLYNILSQNHRNFVFFTSKTSINFVVSHEEDDFFCYKCEILCRKEAQLFILEREYKVKAHHKRS